MRLKWAYAPVDKELLACGIVLFEGPVDHFGWQPYEWKRQGLGIKKAPVIIDTLGDTHMEISLR